MKRQIIFDYPPNFGLIDATFNVYNKPVIYAFGDVIYNPKSIAIGDELLAHENVHCTRQADTPFNWWRNYCSDVEFRGVEELLAHQVEYGAYCAKQNRHGRRVALDMIAARLASPLYGLNVSKVRAKQLIKTVTAT